MLYLINQTILFDEGECSIANEATAEVVFLPSTTARLLSFFLTHSNTVLTRHEILTSVWDSYGYQATNNTLTQHVSILRKNFSLIGEVSEIIITVPKKGLKLSSHTNVQLINSKAKSSDDASIYNNSESNDYAAIGNQSNVLDENRDQDLSRSPVAEMKRECQKMTVFSNKVSLLLLSGVICLVLLISLYYFTLKTMASAGEIDAYEAGKIGACTLLFFRKEDLKTIELSSPVIEKVAQQYLPCLPGSIYYADAEDSLTFDGEGRLSLSRCYHFKDEPEHILYCRSLYFYVSNAGPS